MNCIVMDTRCSDGESPESYTSSEMDSSGDEKQFSPTVPDPVVIVDSDSDSMPMEDVPQLNQAELDDTFVDVVSPYSPSAGLSYAAQDDTDDLMSGHDFDSFMIADEEATAHYQEMLEANPDTYQLLDDGTLESTFLNSIDSSILTSFDNSNLFDFNSRNYMDVRLPSPELKLEHQDGAEVFSECLNTMDQNGNSEGLMLDSTEPDMEKDTNSEVKYEPAIQHSVVHKNLLSENQAYSSASSLSTVSASTPQVLTTPVFIAQGAPGPGGRMNSIITTHMARIVPAGDGSSYVLQVGLSNSGKSNTDVQPKTAVADSSMSVLGGQRVFLTTAKTQGTASNLNTGSLAVTAPHGSSTLQGVGTSSNNTLMVSMLSGNESMLRLNHKISNQSIFPKPSYIKVAKSTLSPSSDQLKSKSYRRRNSKEIRELAELEELTSAPLNGELNRFVICSDGDMKCALCGFRTVSYSSFKSHIICSHPCWRITKKLSRNRLLVEKSVKVNIPVSNFSVPNPIPAVPIQQRVQTKRSRKRPPVSEASSVDVQSVINRQTVRKTESTSYTSPRILKNSSLNLKSATALRLPVFRCTKCLSDFRQEADVLEHLLTKHQVRRRPYHFVQVSLDAGKTFQSMHRCTHPNCTFSGSSRFELNVHLTSAHESSSGDWS